MENRVFAWLCLLIAASLMCSCGSGVGSLDSEATVVAAVAATTTALVPKATNTPTVDLQETVQAAIAATQTAAVPTETPLPTATPTPTPLILKPLASTSLWDALLAPADLTFGGLYTKSAWSRGSAGSAFLDQNPALKNLVVKSTGTCWQASGGYAAPMVCDWIYVTRDARSAMRLASSLGAEGRDVMAIVFGRVSTQSLQLEGQSIQLLEGRDMYGSYGGILIVISEEAVREIRAFRMTLVSHDLIDLAVVAADKLKVARR